MPEQTSTERTAGGWAGRIVGKVKEVAGEMSGRSTLAREGRLQSAQAEAELDAKRDSVSARHAEERARLEEQHRATETERRRLENDVAASRRDEAIESNRRSRQAGARGDAATKAQAAERAREAEHAAAEEVERSGKEERLDAARDAVVLDDAARQAERRADAIEEQTR